MNLNVKKKKDKEKEITREHERAQERENMIKRERRNESGDRGRMYGKITTQQLQQLFLPPVCFLIWCTWHKDLQEHFWYL